MLFHERGLLEGVAREEVKNTTHVASQTREWFIEALIKDRKRHTSTQFVRGKGQATIELQTMYSFSNI